MPENTTESPLRKSLRLCTQEGLFATPFVFLSLPGNLILASLLLGVLGLGKSQYGVIVALPAIFNGLQLVVTPFLSRQFSARNLTLWFSWINLFFWTLLTFALPWLPSGETDLQKLALALTVLFIFIAATQSMLGVCWTAWVQEWIPSKVRGQYFGRRNALLGLGTVAFVWLAGRSIDWSNNQLWAYQLILIVTAILRFVSIRMQVAMPTDQVHQKPRQLPKTGWLSQMYSMLHEKCFMRFVAFGSCMGFLFAFIGPFMPAYMKTELGLSVGRQAELMLLSSIFSALCMPFWGKLTDKIGSRTIIAGCLIPWMISNYLWLIVHPGNTWLLYPMWILGGMMSSGVVLGGFNLLLKLLPSDAKTSGISMHLAATSAAAALGPIASGFIQQGADVLGFSMRQTFFVFFLVYPTLMLLSILFLRKVVEPQQRQFSSGMGAFRTLRQVFIMEGLVTLANVVPVRRKRKV